MFILKKKILHTLTYIIAFISLIYFFNIHALCANNDNITTTITTCDYKYSKKAASLMKKFEKLANSSDDYLINLSSKKHINGNLEYTQTTNYSSSFYLGKIKNGKPDGFGVIFQNYSGQFYVPYYIGEFKEGYYHGYGITYEIDSSYYYYYPSIEAEYKKGAYNGDYCEYYYDSSIPDYDYTEYNDYDDYDYDDDYDDYDNDYYENDEYDYSDYDDYDNSNSSESLLNQATYFGDIPIIFDFTVSPFHIGAEGQMKKGNRDGDWNLYTGNNLYASVKYSNKAKKSKRKDILL